MVNNYNIENQSYLSLLLATLCIRAMVPQALCTNCLTKYILSDTCWPLSFNFNSSSLLRFSYYWKNQYYLHYTKYNKLISIEKYMIIKRAYSFIVWKQHYDRSNWSRNYSKFIRPKSKYITNFPIIWHSQIAQKLWVIKNIHVLHIKV